MAKELVVYPDAHPEVSSVDGVVAHYLGMGSGISWPSLIITPGSYSNDVTPMASIVCIASDNQAGKWISLDRAIYLFDTSELPDGAIILAATFSVGGYQKTDTGGWLPNINVYGAAPASDIALVAGDFASFGSTPYCDNPIAYGDWNTAGYNDFILNEAGLAAIDKSGITKLGLRNANYDVAGISPTWVSEKAVRFRGVFAEQELPYRPKLVITYEIEKPTVTTNPATEVT